MLLLITSLTFFIKAVSKRGLFCERERSAFMLNFATSGNPNFFRLDLSKIHFTNLNVINKCKELIFDSLDVQ